MGSLKHLSPVLFGRKQSTVVSTTKYPLFYFLLISTQLQNLHSLKAYRHLLYMRIRNKENFLSFCGKLSSHWKQQWPVKLIIILMRDMCVYCIRICVYVHTQVCAYACTHIQNGQKQDPIGFHGSPALWCKRRVWLFLKDTQRMFKADLYV